MSRCASTGTAHRLLPCSAVSSGVAQVRWIPAAKLNVGCGRAPAAGWINCGRALRAGVDVCGDARGRLPLATGAVAAIAAIHLLQDLQWTDIAPTLAEFRRVLSPGGTLRLGLPDLDRAIRAYLEGDAAWFYVPDHDAQSPGAKLVTQIVWYGSAHTPMTFGFIAERLDRAGFTAIERRTFGDSRVPGLAALDNRMRESFFVEGVSPGGPSSAR